MAQAECPECGVRMRVADDLPAGRKVRCPKCEAVFRASDAELEPAEDRRRSAAPARRMTGDAAEDDYDDERPRKRAAKEGKSPIYWILLGFSGLAAAGAVGFLIVTMLGPGKMNLDTTFDLDSAKPSRLYTF